MPDEFELPEGAPAPTPGPAVLEPPAPIVPEAMARLVETAVDPLTPKLAEPAPPAPPDVPFLPAVDVREPFPWAWLLLGVGILALVGAILLDRRANDARDS